MKVISINPTQNIYQKSKFTNQPKQNFQKINTLNNLNSTKTPSFKGDTGAVIGIVGGMATGALTAAVIVASGGLAAPVAAIGLGGVMTTGAACGTHIGGIIGHFIEENLGK